MVIVRRPVPGWPAVLGAGGVVLRPYQRSDAPAWSAQRLANEAWLSPWEPTPPESWGRANSPAGFRRIHAAQRRAGYRGEAMTFAICVREDGTERYVGHLNLGNIVRRAFCSAFAGYWVDHRVAGRGVMPTALALAVDHAFGPGGLHRVEVNIRPENTPSRRVVEKLGFREEAHHPRYLHIDGAWRDHVGYALTMEDVEPEGGLLARWQRARERR
ncbi:ribosomal-protein-alanine N-acetyltransferase [Pilimelia anulata]|uniref:Ribosomal-protein-alanine N-acetyltransferase n=1 Tax=Pilimelia anulata TaxID=53371 RepID=A0A8J3B375_9ACTN|nr:GNAT family protein [Pilimelia anulata]GGJ92208.1 ribosomal-protein-alanine N-acetyltransferase [Pilimelia anulata]